MDTRVGIVIVGKKLKEFRQSRNAFTSALSLYWNKFTFQSPPQKQVLFMSLMLFNVVSKYGKNNAIGKEGDL